MKDYREKPKQGIEWLGNASLFERQRVEYLEEADRREAAGDIEGAARYRHHAATTKTERDRDQDTMLRRQLNRSIHRRY